MLLNISFSQALMLDIFSIAFCYTCRSRACSLINDPQDGYPKDRHWPYMYFCNLQGHQRCLAWRFWRFHSLKR